MTIYDEIADALDDGMERVDCTCLGSVPFGEDDIGDWVYLPERIYHNAEQHGLMVTWADYERGTYTFERKRAGWRGMHAGKNYHMDE